GSSGGVSIFRTSAPMSARNMPGSSAGGTRAISRILMPSRTPIESLLGSFVPPACCSVAGVRDHPRGGASALRIRGLDRRRPESGIVAGKDPRGTETRDRLESFDGMHRPRRIPDHSGRNLLVDGALPVAAVAGEDHGPALRELHQERLVPRR